ncbi:riboflavin synthase subunit alpha [Helicobacter mustelae]|uniref:riboflavin synthase n=1 Tax=Helicobacter mustelae TaxID=217 RepID=UPI000E073655|nr:riboflavin synthase [Helicobacter mustelae]STP13053.1 riboflavin synthase subunit alpha [Helicobacter mustelae]
MFNGLIQEIAKVKEFKNNILKLEAAHQPGIGDSIAVNGVCLTVIECFEKGFALELSAHTQKTIALENYQKQVHIEPALSLHTRIDGHLVQGHVDGVGSIKKITKKANQIEMQIKAPKEILALCIPKGSICIDGVSLTIAGLSEDFFELVLIPHTFSQTLFHTYKIGRRVNIETDMIVRSIATLMQGKTKTTTWDALDSFLLSY